MLSFPPNGNFNNLLWDLLYELMFPRAYSGTGWSEHEVDDWIWNMNKKRHVCFFTQHFQNSWTSPPSVLSFVQKVLNFVQGVCESVGSQQNININVFISTQIGSLPCWLPAFCDSHEHSPSARSVHLLVSVKMCVCV